MNEPQPPRVQELPSQPQLIPSLVTVYPIPDHRMTYEGEMHPYLVGATCLWFYLQ